MNFLSGYRALGLSLIVCSILSHAAATPLPQVATGASVDESRVQKTYYVDAASAEAADDEKHGSQEEPFATLARACRAAADDKDRGIGTKIILAAGVYREAAEIRAPPGDQPDTAAPLIIEAAEREQAVIDGADVEGWTASTWQIDASSHWVHAWPFARVPLPTRNAHAPVPPAAPGEAYQRGHLLFINGQPLRQVDALADLAPGTCWLPEASARHESAAGKSSTHRRGAVDAAPAVAAGTVVVQPPADTERASAVIQVGRRAHGLAICNRCNVVVRGLLFQHAADPAAKGEATAETAGLVLVGCSNVLVEDVLSQWNDGAGVVISGRTAAPWTANVTLRRVRMLHNGGSGLEAAHLKNLLAEDCETSFNNFRGEWAGWIDPNAQSGANLRSLHGSTWRRHRAESNACRGLWWNGDCTDVALEDAVVRNNLVSGLLVTNSPGPVRVRRCQVTGNRLPPVLRGEPAYPGAISILATPDVTMESNLVVGNALPQLDLWNDSASVGSINFETGVTSECRTTGHSYHHNVFCGFDSAEALCVLPTPDRAGRGSFSSYYQTLVSDENLFWNAAAPEAFYTFDHAIGRLAGRDFAAWKPFLSALTSAGNDGTEQHPPEANSLWQDPLFIDGADADYRLRAGSPVAGWNLPADEGVAE